MKRRLLFSTALAWTALGVLPACAESPVRPLPPLSPPSNRIGSLMQLSVVDRASGRELPIYRHRGEYWVAGRPGTRYAIRARNAMGERVMAVMSVDGVNIVTGETAGVLQNGYVFSGGERSDITGWRKSDSQIAAFEFTSIGNSYASRTGRPDDVGVIGVAMFRERVPEPPPAPPIVFPRRDGSTREMERRNGAPSAAAEAAPAAPAAQARSADSALGAEAAASAKGSLARPAPSSPSLGTAHGRRETSHVGHTRFERAQSTPDEVVRIRYDSRENLIAAGVIPVPPPARWPRPEGPSAFPGSEMGYVPDPPARYE
uniref:Lipoprotein n=1 Tax=Variovorax paradoxus (strain S110) TaxID=543728 RepID=C5CMW9_VARPS